MFPKHLLTVSAVFVAVFLIVATINTQPILSPKSASADPPPGQGPNCPTGSSFNFSTGRCEAPPCPQGTLQNGQCVTTTTSTPATCTGTLDTQTGQCTSTTDAGRPTCSAGTSPGFGVNGEPICGLIKLPGEPCPAGTHFVASVGSLFGRCVSDTTPTPVCSSGNLNLINLECYVTTTTNVCQSPAVFQNGQGCVTTTSTPATCPAGTALSGNVCAGHPIPKGPKQT